MILVQLRAFRPPPSFSRMTSRFWPGLMDRRKPLRRRASGGLKGSASRWALIGVACGLLCILAWAACSGNTRTQVEQRQDRSVGSLQKVGARKLVGEWISANASAEDGVGKEEKRAKKVSNAEMLGEHDIPPVVQSEVAALIAAEEDLEPWEMFECDRQSPLTDVCTLRGDVRVNVPTGEIVLYAKDPRTPRGVLLARPHPRKWDFNVMEDVMALQIRSVDAISTQGILPLSCTSRESGPAAVFSVGGYCGGVFHDFNEVFLPLFQTVHRFARNVVLLMADLKGPWWWRGAPPAETVVGSMTQHPIRLLGQPRDADGQGQGVLCFDHVIVGLSHHLCMYDEFGGQETRSETLAGVQLNDFGPFVAQGLQVEETGVARVAVPEGSTPVVAIVQRLGSRVLLNFEAMLAAAEQAGYRAVPLVLERLRPREVVRAMRQLDVLVAVHGAGLANIALMRPGGVVMQILPYGEWGAGRLVGREYRTLADYQGAKYLEWHVPLHDSSLMDTYALTEPILMDPDSVWREQHTLEAMRIYHNQNVSMPEDMFGAYLRHISKDLHFKERLRAEFTAEVDTNG